MTFHQRANLLKAVGLHLIAEKEPLYELSTTTGATRADSWIDIEGGAGVLLGYASKGRRERRTKSDDERSSRPRVVLEQSFGTPEIVKLICHQHTV